STRFLGQPSETRPIFIQGTLHFNPSRFCVTFLPFRPMKRLLALIAAVSLAATVSAQSNAGLAGTWTIDRAATPGGGAGRGAGAIAGIPIATTIVIKVSPGDGTVDSYTGSGQTLHSRV